MAQANRRRVQTGNRGASQIEAISGHVHIRYRADVPVTLNMSSRNTERFEQLHEFASEFFTHAAGTRIILFDSTQGYTAGEARVVQYESAEAVCSITLWLAGGRTYPVTDTYCVAEVGAPTFHDEAEEALYVLAHEMQHVDDFRAGYRNVDQYSSYMMELRAERTAREVLEAWRLVVALRAR